jgi:cytochrome oxidase complex assembly protein 1
MSTKKIIVIVLAIVITIGLLALIFVGGIIGLALYSVGNSEAAVTAKDFLQKNDQLKQDIGAIKDFGKIVTGSVNVHNRDGEATMNLKVIGERRTVNATVELAYSNGRNWRVTAASYTNEAGETVDLLRAYDSQLLITLLVA